MKENLNISNWNYIVAASVPIFIIALFLSYIILNYVEKQKASHEVNNHLEMINELEESIVVLQKIRGLEQIYSRIDKDNKTKKTIFQNIRKLNEQFIQTWDNLNFTNNNSADLVKGRNHEIIKNRVLSIFSDTVSQVNADKHFMEYAKVIQEIQQWIIFETSVPLQLVNERDEAGYLLTLYSQSIMDLSENVGRLRGIGSGAIAMQSESGKTQLSLAKLLGAMQKSREDFDRQYILLIRRTKTNKVDWSKEKIRLDRNLNEFVNVTQKKLNNFSNGVNAVEYFEIATSVIDSAMELNRKLQNQIMRLDKEKLSIIKQKKYYAVIIGVAGIFIVLYFAIRFFRNNSENLRKMKDLNDSLVHSEENIRRIIEVLPHVVVLHDTNGNFLMENRAYRELVADMEEKDVKKLRPGVSLGNSTQQVVDADLDVHQFSKTMYTRQESFVGRNGEKKILEISTISYPARGNENAFLSVMVDMTEFYKVRELQKISGVGYWEWDIGRNKFNYSDKFYETIGMKHTRGVDDFYTYLDCVLPVDRLQVMVAFSKAKETNQPIDIEHRVLKKDGKVSIVKVSGKIHQRNLDDTIHMVGSIQDITFQKQAAEALKQSELKYRKLVENLSEAYFFYSYNKTGEITYISPSVVTVLGYTAREISELRVMNPLLISRHGQSTVSNSSTQTFDHQSHLEIEVKHRDNSIRNLELSEVPAYSPFGEIIGFDGIAHDVTEQKLAETELRESEYRLRELATHLQDVRENERASIAHDIHDEIGGYLMALKMDISLLSKKIEKKEAQINSRFQSMTQLLDVAIESTRRMITNLRPSILDELGLLEAIEWQLNDFCNRFDLDIIFNRGYEACNLKFKEPEHSVAVFRMFQEILNNIAKHAEAKTITAFAAVNANAFVLSVSDDGKGIEKSEYSKKGSYGILGMQERIKKMDGTMFMYGSKNSGTTVIMQIPLEDNCAALQDFIDTMPNTERDIKSAT